MSFCIDTIRTDSALRPDNGVLRIAALAVTADAREAAQRILDDANTQAEAILARAEQEAKERTRQAEEDTLRRAAELIRMLEDANATLLQKVEPVVVEMAQALFERLTMETTSSERVQASLRRLTSEAPSKLVNPVLRVHPDDAGLLPAVEWEVVHDGNLVPGTCLLQADSGEWRADFSAAVVALKDSFTQAMSGDDASLGDTSSGDMPDDMSGDDMSSDGMSGDENESAE